jgi:ADP-ribose 1''-phosphate phosphatase
MKRQLEDLQNNSQSGGTTTSDDPVQPPGELWSCRFNSGLFAVKWDDTRSILEESGLEIMVVRPPGEEY